MGQIDDIIDEQRRKQSALEVFKFLSINPAMAGAIISEAPGEGTAQGIAQKLGVHTQTVQRYEEALEKVREMFPEQYAEIVWYLSRKEKNKPKEGDNDREFWGFN